MNRGRKFLKQLFLNPPLRVAAFGTVALIALALSSLSALADSSQNYTGNVFTFFSCGPNAMNTATMDCPNDPAPGNTLTSYTATDHVTATLTTTSPLPANLNYADVTSLPGFSLTMHDGQQTLTSATACCTVAKVSTDGSGNIIGPWLVFINQGNTADSGIGTENEPPVNPFVQDSGVLACCDPTIHGDIAINQFNPGTWNSGSASPATQVSNLITLIQGMQIPQQGMSLISQLQQLLADINSSGPACQDLNAFANHVQAQTGKKILTTQANQIMTADASIYAALNCGP